MKESGKIDNSENPRVDLQEALETLSKSYWSIHDRLSGNYTNRNEQSEDMVRAGNIAKSMQSIRFVIEELANLGY